MKFDEVLERYIGSCGKYQALIVIFACYYGIPSCLTTVDLVFIAGTPLYRCSGGVRRVDNSSTDPQQAWRNSTTWSRDSSCSGYYRRNETESGQENGQENGTLLWHGETLVERTCDDFEYDTSMFKSTLITEWDMVCERSFLVSISKSVAMAGVMVGAGLGGFIADRFGRRPVILVTIVLTPAARFILSLSPSLTFFNVFNFLCVVGNGVGYIVIFTLSMELVGPKWRATVGTLIGETFGLGYIILAGLAYLMPRWKILNLSLAASYLPCLLLYCILPESPRWLLAKGRTDEAYSTMRKIAQRNGRVLPPDVSVQKQEDEDGPKYSVVDLLKHRRLVCRYLIIFFAWFVAAFTYYGITLNMGSLVGNIYINFAVTGVLELLGYFLSQFMVAAPTGRRLTTSGLYLSAGVCLLLTLAIPDSMPIGVTVLVQLGRFCVSAFYNCIYIWSGELFPTVIRNSGLSTTSCIGKIGAVIAPYAAELGRLHESVPIVTFGGLALLCGLGLLTLPETRGRPLPQTIEDVMRMKTGKQTPLTVDVQQEELDKLQI